MAENNRFVQAFKESGNVIGLTSAVALSVALLNPLPLLVGLVAEAAYLIFVPDSQWFASRLSARHDAEIEARRQQVKLQVLPQITPEMRERFIRLEGCRAAIGRQPVGQNTPGGDQWFREVLRKLDYLLERFLAFSGKDAEFRRHLRTLLDDIHGESHGVRRQSRPEPRKKARGGRSAPARHDFDIPLSPGPPESGDRWAQSAVEEIEAHYVRELEGLERDIAAEADSSTLAILEKRREVLRRRQEGVVKIGKILRNLSHQLALLEDTFGLINDEIRARSPEQVLSEIEEVVLQTESMTELLEELAPFQQLEARLAG
jgi:hypothetical protein